MDNIKIDSQNSNHTNHIIDSNSNSTNISKFNIIKPDNNLTSNIRVK